MSIDSRPSTASGKAKSESQKSTVIETVYVPTKDNADDKAYAERSIKASKGLFQGRMNSSRERHERFLTRQKYGVNADGPDQINALMLDRIKRGYVFNCLRNIELFEDDPWLQDVWTWVEGAEEAAVDDGMVSGRLDLSYVGVQNVWNNDLGSNWLSRITDPDDDHRVNDEEWIRALADLNARSRRSTFKSVPTKRPHHRLMCLAICGWGKSDEELERDLIRLEAKGLFTKAAAWALFEKKPRRAVDSLQRGGKNLLFIGLALSLQVNGAPVLRKEDWDSSMSDLSGMSDDPYLRAIYALISTGDWRAIANEASLPMRDRVGVALHNLDDTELPNWLNRQTAEAVRTGDIEGVVLVGITDQTVPLLSKYIEKFGDYQTASLLIHFAAPLYIDDFRIWQWRADYQDLHNKNRLFVDRCHYEAASTKKSRDRNTGVTVITPKPRQVTLRCMHCDTAFTNDVDNTSMRRSGQKSGAVMSSGDRNALYPSGVHAGICCPKCGKHLPRCGICLLTLGLPRSDKELSIGMEVGTKEKLKNFMSFCMKCDHAFHAEHARKWFGVHNECPVPECHCACNVDGGGMVGMEREGE